MHGGREKREVSSNRTKGDLKFKGEILESIYKADVKKTHALITVVFLSVLALLIIALYGIISNLYNTGDLFSIQRLWGHLFDPILPLILIWILYKTLSVATCYPYIKINSHGFEIKNVWVQSILWTEIQGAQLRRVRRSTTDPVVLTTNYLYLLIKLKDYKKYRAQNPFYLRLWLDYLQKITLEDGENYLAIRLSLYTDREEILNVFEKYLAKYGH